MNVDELYRRSLHKLSEFSIQGLMPALRMCNEGAVNDVLNVNGCAYYQLTPGLIEILKPKQIVELGGAMGVWSICVLHALPKDSHLWSITLPEGGLEYSFMTDTPSNFHPVLGDDLDLTNWPKELDLHKTDLWFFDSLHTREQLTKELELYTPFFKKGAVLLFDDIRMPELRPVWDSLSYEKLDVTDPFHFTGFGMCIV